MERVVCLVLLAGVVFVLGKAYGWSMRLAIRDLREWFVDNWEELSKWAT